MSAVSLLPLRLKSIARHACAACAIGVLLCAPAGAATPYALYDSGSPVISSGYISGIFWLAHDFTIDSPSAVLALRIYLTYTDPGDLTGVEWEFYSDAGGTPGTLLSRASAVGTRTLIGTANGYVQGTYQVDLTLPEIVHLDTGRYWLAINTLGSSLDEPFIYWTNSISNADNSAIPMMTRSFYGNDTWHPNWGDSAFQIVGVPEPDQWMSLGLGVAMLYALHRKRNLQLKRADKHA